MTHDIAPVRSMLFVPANKLRWIQKGVAAGADAIILDLEDAVAAADTEQARADLRCHLEELDGHTDVPLFVRINAMDSHTALEDLDAVVRPGLLGIMIPKVVGSDDVVVADRILTWFEDRRGLPAGSVCIIPVMETAQAIRKAYEIARASERVAYLGGLGVKGGDVERAIGYRWSAAGLESLMIRSSVLLDARAAGVANPLTGLWSDVADVDGLRRFCEHSRDIGYEGMLAIHPNHVPVINDVFTPTATELDRDRALVAAMEAAARAGSGATTFEGEMVDEAMAATARARLVRYAGSSDKM